MSHSGSTLPQNNASLAIRAYDDDFLEDMERELSRGRDAYAQLTQAINEHADNTDETFLDADEWEIESTQSGRAAFDYAHFYVLGYIGIHEPQYETFRGIRVTYKGINFPRLFYGNVYSVATGTISAKDNRGRMMSPQVVAPQRWHHVVFAVWNWQCTLHHQDVSVLKYIIRQAVVNSVTKFVMNALVPDPWFDKPYVFTPPDKGFFALLGTPNCIGIAHLCRVYARALNYKTITKITIILTRLGVWDIVLELNPARPDSPEPSPQPTPAHPAQSPAQSPARPAHPPEKVAG